jgi:hypothetical protein
MGLIVVIVAAWFFPLFASLEIGQIDSVCLLLLSLGFYKICGPTKNPFCGGLWIAFATLLKLHCGLIFVFLILRRQWKACMGFIAGGVAMGALSLLINGWQANYDYATKEVPRISRFASFGTDEMILPRFKDKIHEFREGMEMVLEKNREFPIYSEKQGKTYFLEPYKFQLTASIGVYLRLLDEEKVNFSRSSMIVVAFLCMLVFYSEWAGKRLMRGLSAEKEWIFFNIGMLVILIGSPVTHTMNAVWLLPLVFLVIKHWKEMSSREWRTALLLIVTGLIISGLPDETAYVRKMALHKAIYNFKPVMGEVLCFVGLLRMLPLELPESGSESGEAKSKNSISTSV